MSYDGACQPYEGELTRGYGLAYLGVVQGTRIRVPAHRLAYALHYGVDPEGLVVRHRCDNPPCVNPDHLELGTQSDNVRDMYSRNRSFVQRPQRSHKSKLTEEQVLEIRRHIAGGASRSEVARLLGVDTSTVSLIAARKTWRWL